MATCPNCGAPAAADAAFCSSCGSALAAPGAEERKLATILFADVIGSTDLGEQLDPERLRILLQEYFAAMSRVVEEWGGTVEKYIGDAILAVFGVPAAREDDPIRALHAATEMLAELNRLNSGFDARHGVRLAVRIGINTGEVLAPVGARSAGQFLVSGDPVNVAARLEQAAQGGTVLVSERTWAAARHAFSFGVPVELELKGKREPVLARRLGEALGSEERGVHLHSRMVGRDRELATLTGLLDEGIETGVPRMVLISGPAGIGKSRLLREFISAAKDPHPDLSVYRGRCLAVGHGITFWALGEILRAACAISLDEPAESAAEKLRLVARERLAGLELNDQELENTIFALATSANLRLADNPFEQQAPEAVGEEMARAWPRFLTGLASTHPTTVLIEDIHWADERMIRMLELLVARSRGRLLLVATARPEFVEAHLGLAAGEDATVIALRPLTESQSNALVEQLLGESDLPSPLLAEIRQKAEGNPFFLEEILQRLIDEGALVSHERGWRATERATVVHLPDTIHALLAARIDGLPNGEKRLMQEAAVVGRIFWPGPLIAALNGAGAAEALRSLEHRGLVGARPTSTIEGEPEYIFRHVLIRDVAYASVPKARRAVAHAETGRWIEKLAGDRIEEFGELLAYHYTTAVAAEDADLAWADQPDEREDIRRRAFEVLLRAGAAARHRFAIEKALELHGQALELAVDDAGRAGCHEALGDDHEAAFHMDEAVAAYLAAVESARQAGDDATVIGNIAVKLAATAQRWGAFKQAPPYDAMIALVKESLGREVGERLRAELLVSSGALAASQPRRSARASMLPEDRESIPKYIPLIEEGLAIAKRLDDPVLQYRAYDVLQLLYWHTGDVEANRFAIERQVELIDRLPSRRDKVDVLVAKASADVEAGQYRAALATAEKAFNLAAELSPHERMHASFELMLAAQALGDWDRVLEILPWHAQAAAAEPNVNCPNVRGGAPLGATVMVWRGEIERAVDLVPIDEGASKRETLTDRSFEARYAALTGRNDVATAIADQMTADPDRALLPDGAEAFLETLVYLERREDIIDFLPAARRLAKLSALIEPVADRAEATLAIEAGRPADARRLLEAALARFEALSVPFEAARTREVLATVADPAEAATILRTALETYERLGAKPFAERVRSAVAAIPIEPPTNVASP